MKISRRRNSWTPTWLAIGAGLIGYSLYDPAFGMAGGIMAAMCTIIGCGWYVGLILIFRVAIPLLVLGTLIHDVIVVSHHV